MRIPGGAERVADAEGVMSGVGTDEDDDAAALVRGWEATSRGANTVTVFRVLWNVLTRHSKRYPVPIPDVTPSMPLSQITAWANSKLQSAAAEFICHDGDCGRCRNRERDSG